ncbi:response regulator [Limnovirga soli]|uniref:Response regulator n=1 Tax=Limnovirga soli TaxID=2656915 RepID=A0A8J8JVQ5_9BACT|nr:response regulator [Limnovirga soli]NNV56884.1 response regulator [Limnovirga soli]
MQIKVFIYDDNTARRDSLKALIELSPELLYAGEGINCLNVLNDMQTHFPDVVLMDINMPGANGIEGLKLIKQEFPHIKVLMQTVFDDNDNVFECIRNGASGYILKKDAPQRILQAIQEVNEGGAVMNPSIALKVLDYFKPGKKENPLSARETQVLELLAEGLSYKMVGDKLFLSFNTVNTHVKHIYEKLHVSSLGEAIAFYYKNLH